MLQLMRYTRALIVLVTTVALLLPGVHYFYRAAEAAPMNMPTLFRCHPGSLWHHYYTDPSPFPGIPHYCLRAEEIGHDIPTWASLVDGSRFVFVVLMLMAAMYYVRSRPQLRDQAL